MAFKSKEAQAKYHREVWYPRNKQRRLELNDAWQAKQRELFYEFKKTLKCVVCGESESACLDFHHKDPSEKEGAIANIVRGNRSFDAVLKEVEKCVVLCANCHRKFHAGALEATW